MLAQTQKTAYPKSTLKLQSDLMKIYTYTDKK